MINCKFAPESNPAIPAPKNEPRISPGVRFLNTGQITALFLLWAINELIEVTMIVANEVPKAICMMTSGWYPI